MKRVPVDSSSVAGVGYDSGTATLEIEFRNGGVYRYFGVPERHFRALTEQADSVGRHVNLHIRDCYEYERVR